jgi:hypothetical protein
MVEDGFSPGDFDDRLGEHRLATTSFNFACHRMTPALLRLLSRRAVEDLSAREVKVDAIYLEFAPHMATRRMVARSGEPSANARHAASLLRTKDLLSMTWRSPESVAQTGGLWLLGWHRPGELTRSLADRFFDPPAELTDPTIMSQLRELRADPVAKRMRRRGFTAAAWDSDRRGETFRLTAPDEIALVDRMNALGRIEADPRENRVMIDRYDWLDLDFDPDQIEDFIAAFDELRRLSDRVYVLVMPRQPQFRTPTTEAHLQALCRRFRDRGMPVVSFFESPAFSSADFKDSAHLKHHSGRAKLSTQLAEHLTSQLDPEGER